MLFPNRKTSKLYERAQRLRIIIFLVCVLVLVVALVATQLLGD